MKVVHAVSALLPLRHLMRSDNMRAKKIVGRLLKTTAAVMQVHGAGGDYKQVLRPVTTAWAQ